MWRRWSFGNEMINCINECVCMWPVHSVCDDLWLVAFSLFFHYTSILCNNVNNLVQVQQRQLEGGNPERH